MAVDPIQLAIGGLIGFGGAGMLRFWQYRRDLWIVSVNECCSTIISSAELATIYWNNPKKQRRSSDQDGHESYNQQLRAEASIIGLQVRIDEYVAFISSRLLDKDRLKIENCISNFSEALTGGRYGSESREADSDRARLAQIYASEAVTTLRISVIESLSIAGTIKFYAKKFHRRYNAPMIE